SDMDEEDEQEDQEELEVEEQPSNPSDLGGVPWKEAVELHGKLRGDQGDDLEGEAVAHSPVDPNTIPSLVRAQLDSEGDQDDPLASVLQHSQPSELTQPSSTGNPPRGATNRTQIRASTC
ncbi:hypothetical protein GOODEAATRI_015595, partial [Goodea atripinnis]